MAGGLLQWVKNVCHANKYTQPLPVSTNTHLRDEHNKHIHLHLRDEGLKLQ